MSPIDYDVNLPLLVAFWCITLAAVIVMRWRKPHPTSGLVLAYVFHLSMIHLMGAFIYMLPWYFTYDLPLVEIGFREGLNGLVFFAIGSIFIAPLLEGKTFKNKRKERQPDPRLPEVYLVVGLVFYFILTPILGHIPSIAALVYSGSTLIQAGLCLACFRALGTGSKKKLFMWIAISSVVPFFTALTQGFLGLGVIVLLVVLSFVASVYRPRWHVVVYGLILIYLGISLFVNYARERSELRQLVWYEQAPMKERGLFLVQMIQNFELFDLHDPVHLEKIDDRLNQNILVGAAVEYLGQKREKFAMGRTVWEATLSVVPRILWPEKPMTAGSGNMVSQYTGIMFAENTSVGVGQVLEFYINFGTLGVMLGFLVLGTIVTIIDDVAGKRLTEGDWKGFVFMFLPGLGLLQAGGSLVEVISTCASALLLCYLINKTVVPWLESKNPPTAGKTVSKGTL